MHEKDCGFSRENKEMTCHCRVFKFLARMLSLSYQLSLDLCWSDGGNLQALPNSKLRYWLLLKIFSVEIARTSWQSCLPRIRKAAINTQFSLILDSSIPGDLDNTILVSCKFKCFGVKVMEGFLFVLFSHRYPPSASSSCCWERKLILKSEISHLTMNIMLNKK